MQLRDLGRESVTSTMCGAGKESLVRLVGGGGVVKGGFDIVGEVGELGERIEWGATGANWVEEGVVR